ncbi:MULTISPECIES: hypothetical protein [Mycolicibacterium]|uniref:Copper resistance protein D domain-containing protein n=1 Tax=Mycolicibacterium elephantis TaxID=81858 RepID=A0A0M2ZL70_9MYCO|nr:hypothetical protein [Mycolicibacterium elephantis]KKW66272.1 hypothetical protein AAV95_02160 [Mycolicibacterium elephantis]OBA69012.1 hypothetical protein A5633_25120 [Mycolicibacterium elephantis]OBB23341.1 hypothetical protein A5762_01420 [Mycolicibacterium elephantis]OBE98862.1 hypothetical protein A5776_13390 [Mycolicibacterium elephantis]ORA61923.1 hypothetical protein BST23_20595 [Mycolicibacterium elephantis]
MIDIWTVVRFLHVVGAIVWVGGQLTVTLIVLPPAHRLLSVPDRAQVLRNVGRRFALVTFAMFLPVQITTGVLLAVRHGVTWTSLSEPGYGRVLIVKVLLFAAVMVAASLHGMAQARRRPRAARTASIASLIGSLGVVLLATALVEGG